MSHGHEAKRRRKARRNWPKTPRPVFEWRSDEDELDADVPVEFSTQFDGWLLRVNRAAAAYEGQYVASIWNGGGDSRELGKFDDVDVAQKACEDLAILLQACACCAKPITTSGFEIVAGAAVHRDECAANLRASL